MKRTMSIVLALVMILSLVLAGCGGNQSANTTAAAAKTTAAAAGTTAAPANDAPDYSDVVIDWYHYCPPIDGRQKAFETADALVMDTLGFQLNTHWIETAEYNAKIQNLVAVGQAPDVFYGAAVLMVPFATDGALYPLDELMDTRMPVSKANVPEIAWPALTFNGSVYAIPPVKDLAENNSVLYYKDKLAETGIEMVEWQRISDLDEMLYELRAWRDANEPESDMPISGFFHNFYRENCLETYAGSTIVTSYPTMEYIEGYEAGTEMFCAFDTPEYLDYIKRQTQLVDDRIYPYDRANFDPESTHRKAGDYWIWYSQGYIEAPKGNTEYDCGLQRQNTSMMYTGYVQAATNMISADTESPEACADFIEFMSTNKEWGTIVRFGIEGVNYKLDENGRVDCAAEGMENIKYWYGVMFGDITNCVLPNDCSDDFADALDDLNNNSLASANLGFTPNTENIPNELAAVKAVVAEYDNKDSLGSGMIPAAELEVLYQEFVEKLHANGIETLKEDFQAQLDAWRAAQ